MNYNTISIEKIDNIAVLRIQRPKVLNALNSEMLDEISNAIDRIKDDDEIYVLVITGEGKAFVAGADIAEMKDKNPMEARKFAEKGLVTFRKLELLEKPVIAAVNGFALGGGCELAMSCDIRIVSSNAKFGQPEVGLGIIPGFAGTQRLSRLVGTSMAKELIFTGAIIDSQKALQIGLASSVTEPEELMEKAMELAGQICKNGQLAVRYAKAAINCALDCDMETGMSKERDLFGLCFASEDQKEGMNAFIEKRKAEFKNK